jgi:sec-independent protein translocase protein TatA
VGLDQPVHWVILLILAGLLFGGYKKLPEMARSAGRSMRVFKTELKGLSDDDEARANAAAPVTPQASVPYPSIPPIQPAPAEQQAAPPAYTAPVEPASPAPPAGLAPQGAPPESVPVTGVQERTTYSDPAAPPTA